MATAEMIAFILYNEDSRCIREWQRGDHMRVVERRSFEAEPIPMDGKPLLDHDALINGTAEQMFEEYNVGEARRHVPRSMSVGDALMLHYRVDGCVFQVAMVCQGVGWKLIPVRWLARDAQVG